MNCLDRLRVLQLKYSSMIYFKLARGDHLLRISSCMQVACCLAKGLAKMSLGQNRILRPDISVAIILYHGRSFATNDENFLHDGQHTRMRNVGADRQELHLPENWVTRPHSDIVMSSGSSRSSTSEPTIVFYSFYRWDVTADLRIPS